MTKMKKKMMPNHDFLLDNVLELHGLTNDASEILDQEKMT